MEGGGLARERADRLHAWRTAPPFLFPIYCLPTQGDNLRNFKESQGLEATVFAPSEAAFAAFIAGFASDYSVSEATVKAQVCVSCLLALCVFCAGFLGLASS